jgi:hypothetical protein
MLHTRRVMGLSRDTVTKHVRFKLRAVSSRALFTMKSVLLSLLILALGIANAAAQNANANNNAGRGKNADESWDALIALTPGKAAPASVPGQTKKTAAQVAGEMQQRAQNAREGAQAAKDFYSAHPTHINVREARKLEPLLALLGVTDADRAYEQTAHQLATVYRNNPANPATDRFEVAALAERVEARARLGGSPFGNKPAELERIADKLRIEFGDSPEAYRFYVSVARTADMQTANRMAGKILQAANVPPEVRSETQQIQERHAMLGTQLNLPLRASDGSAINLAQQPGAITTIFVWAAGSGAEGLGSLLSLKKNPPAGLRMLYLPVGGPRDQASAAGITPPLPGPICFEPADAEISSIERLKVRHTPYVFVLGRDGKLSGYGPASELASLLAAAGR